MLIQCQNEVQFLFYETIEYDLQLREIITAKQFKYRNLIYAFNKKNLFLFIVSTGRQSKLKIYETMLELNLTWITEETKETVCSKHLSLFWFSELKRFAAIQSAMHQQNGKVHSTATNKAASRCDSEINDCFTRVVLRLPIGTFKGDITWQKHLFYIFHGDIKSGIH